MIEWDTLVLISGSREWVSPLWQTVSVNSFPQTCCLTSHLEHEWAGVWSSVLEYECVRRSSLSQTILGPLVPWILPTLVHWLHLESVNKLLNWTMNFCLCPSPPILVTNFFVDYYIFFCHMAVFGPFAADCRPILSLVLLQISSC